MKKNIFKLVGFVIVFVLFNIVGASLTPAMADCEFTGGYTTECDYMQQYYCIIDTPAGGSGLLILDCKPVEN